jgi:DNA-binding NarL/FixJ family response regulator
MVKVLLIEDDKSFIELFREFLDMKYPHVELRHAGSVNEGIKLYKELYKNKKPDIVLIDYNIPGGGGLELLTKIKEIDPDAKTYILTAHATQEQTKKSIEAGAIKVIEKQYEFSKTVDSVVRYLGDESCKSESE